MFENISDADVAQIIASMNISAAVPIASSSSGNWWDTVHIMD